MAYAPHFVISAALLNEVERVAALRERIQSAAVDLAGIPALQKDTRTRNVHASSTGIRWGLNVPLRSAN